MNMIRIFSFAINYLLPQTVLTVQDSDTASFVNLILFGGNMRFNYKSFLAAILLSVAAFCINTTAQNATSDAKLSRELVGLWQDSPHVASGYRDIYRFSKSGKFVFEYNTMNWSKRTLSFSGKWKIRSGKLILTIMRRTDIVGGKRVKTDEMSDSGDMYEIEGGKGVTRNLKPRKIEVKRLGKLKQGEMTKEIKIGKKIFWRISNDPESAVILCLRNTLPGIPTSA